MAVLLSYEKETEAVVTMAAGVANSTPLPVGTLVAVATSPQVRLADATAAATKAYAVVIEAITSPPDSFTTPFNIRIARSCIVGGLSGLVAGLPVYLKDNATPNGSFSSTPGAKVQIVGFAQTANIVRLEPTSYITP